MNHLTTNNPTPRPINALATLSKHFPRAWQQADAFRKNPAGFPDWPDWCFMPLSAWLTIALNSGPQRTSRASLHMMACLGALGAWRINQSIYQFDADLIKKLISTPVGGDLNCTTLFQLPDWCVYVETPGIKFFEKSLNGFFAHLEFDVSSGDPELRLLLDVEEGFSKTSIDLGPWSFEEGFKRMTMRSNFNVEPDDSDLALKSQLQPLVSILFYLCSDEAKNSQGKNFPSNQASNPRQKGAKIIPAREPTFWNFSL